MTSSESETLLKEVGEGEDIGKLDLCDECEKMIENGENYICQKCENENWQFGKATICHKCDKVVTKWREKQYSSLEKAYCLPCFENMYTLKGI
jgi:hypothetical protein